jgi:hypothetical protein
VDFKKAHPQVRQNPRALAKLYSYRQPMARTLSKNLARQGRAKDAIVGGLHHRDHSSGQTSKKINVQCTK